MKGLALVSLAVACGVFDSRAAAAATAPHVTPSGTVTPAPSARARALLLLRQAQIGTFDRSQFTDVMNQVVTPDVAMQIGAQLRPLGAPVSVRFLYTEKRGQSTLYAYRLTWANARLDEMMAIDADQRISGLLFRSSVDPPTDAPVPAAAGSPSPGPALTPG